MSEIKKIIESLSESNRGIKKNLESEKMKLYSLEERKNNLISLRSKYESVAEKKKRMDELFKKRDSLEKDLLLLEKHAEGIKSEVLSFSRYEIQHKSKKEELKQAFINEKRAEISIAELRKEAELKEKESSLLHLEISKKEKLKEKHSSIIEITSWLSSQFSNLIGFTEKNVLVKLRSEFSRLFNSWFSILAGDSFEVKIDENFTPVIMQKELEMDYSFLSGGERTAIALAYRLALNQTINSMLSTIKTRDIIILDEPTEGFSEPQIEKIRDILEELNVTQLIIVSHEQKMEGFVQNIIRVKKESGISLLASNFSNIESYQKP